jgi:hypothetical protein
MKRKMIRILVCIIFVLNSFNVSFASEINFENNEFISIPVFDSMEDAEAALQKGNIESINVRSDNSGGTEICVISPFIVRQWSLEESCELYFNIESKYRVNAVRFKELIVESEYLGINYLKIVPADNANYCTYNTGSTYTAMKTICRDFDVPTSENRVRVRSKGMQVFFNTSDNWIACQY